ncbi:MAG: hypothetical protein LBQ70_01755 [Prevotellaceae bacterium]|jgi:lipopolysaccharide export system protein LptA|nr:hypothetical protein [Prevotellaceae bacterium]
MRNIIITVLCFIPVLLVAQVERDSISSDSQPKKKIVIHNSDLTRQTEADSGTVLRFWHNVEMEHNGVVMACDSATLYPNGIFDAFGHTKVTNGTTVITGDMMTYNENTGDANVRGRIVYLTDGSSTLKTTKIDFNTETEIGYFAHEGVIVDSFRTLESQKGYYYSKTKDFVFIGQVQSDTKDYVLKSDSMIYNTDTKLFTFHSNTHIWAENGYLYCDKGWYNSDADIMFFHRNSYILSSKQEIFADSIYYENIGRKGRLYSNIQVVDTSQRTIAMADFADFDMNTEDFRMRKNPSVILYDDSDSVFVRGDTLYSVTRKIERRAPAKNDSVSMPKLNRPDTVRGEMPRKTDIRNATPSRPLNPRNPASRISGPNSNGFYNGYYFDNYIDTTAVTPPSDSISDINSLSPDMPHPTLTLPSDSVPGDTVNRVADTVQFADSTYKELFAFKNVKLYRTDFQLIGDSMYFNTLDSIWKVYRDPILWDGKKMQIASDSMKFFMKNGEMEHADFAGNAMLVAPEGDPDSTIYFNQIKSKSMKVRMSNRKLNSFEALGNVQTLAFSLTDFIMNKAESTSLKILFESGRMRRITYYEHVPASNIPLVLVREDEIKLPGYKWAIDLRPKSRDDVLNRILRPSERTEREALPKPDFPITKRIDEIELKIKN